MLKLIKYLKANTKVIVKIMKGWRLLIKFAARIFVLFQLIFYIIVALNTDATATNSNIKWYNNDYERVKFYRITNFSKSYNFDQNISSSDFFLMFERLLKFTPVKTIEFAQNEKKALSRLEIISYITKGLNLKTKNNVSIKQYPDINNYSGNINEVKAALSNNIILGYPGKELNLNKKATVAETIAFLNRVLTLYNPEKNIVKVKVKGLSMEPTLLNGSNHFFNKQAYLINKPERGDIILYKSDSGFFIKRVVALANDSVEIKNNKLYINDKVFEIYNKMKFNNSYSKKVIPKGCVYVIGDNVNFSLDSRNSEVGYIANKNIVGKIVLF